MQNSKVKTSPVSNGLNGVSKRVGYMMSTPLSSSTSHTQNSLFPASRISPLRHPPRYFLSNSTPTTSPVSTIKSRPVQKTSGPLLASTRFNVNLGTYTDTKSPGLTSRIVQYDNETKQKHTPTHQAKYNSPGVFPVVHFFKKDIPVISPKAKKVTVRLASPDLNFYNSPSKYTRYLSSSETLPDIRNGHDLELKQTNASTKSVLDALKEISRKRIHMSSEFESTQETTKRQRVDCTSDNTQENNKRVREDSPTQQQESIINNSPSQSIPKKICVVDVLAASYTSSKMLKERLEKGLKRKTTVEEPGKNKQKEIKLINAETQTQQHVEKAIPKATKLTKKLKDNTAVIEDQVEDISKEKISRFSNIFDEKRLEINRKNKLATLLCAITGDTPRLIPYDAPNIQDEDKQSEHKLISILSPQNKPKHDKHVTFNLPPEKQTENADKKEDEIKIEENATIISSENSTIAPASIPIDTKSSLSATTESEKVVVTSISSLVTTTSSANSFTHVVNSLPNTVISSPSIGGFTFKPQEKVVVNINSNEPTFSMNSPLPTVNFDEKSDTSKMITTSHSTPIGGFKFDLTKSTSPPSFSFGIAQNKSDAICKNQSQLQSETSQSVSMPVFGTDMNKPSETFSFGSNSTSSSTIFEIAPPSNTSTGTTAIVIPTVTKENFTGFTNSNFRSNKTTLPIFSTSAPTYGNTSIFTPKITTDTSIASSSMFGSATAIPTLPSASIFNTTSTSASVFGIPSTSTSMFGNTTTTTSSMFGNTTTTTSSMFGNTTTTTSSMFGNTSTSTPRFATASAAFSSAPSASTFSFNSSNNNFTSNNSKASTFGSNIFATTSATTISTPDFTNSVAAFGTPVTSSAISFSNSKTMDFGTPTPSEASKANFGFTTHLPFGANSTPAFGGTTSASSVISFGNPVTSASSGFRTNQITSSSVPSFGTTTSVPTFGTTTSVPTFGTTTSVPTFGTTTSVPTFGTATSSASMFGATTSVPAFGTTTTSVPSFGTNPQASGVPSFGNSAPAFGTNLTTSTPMFGTNAPNTSVFRSNSNASHFGTNMMSSPPPNATLTFNAPSTSASVFDANTPQKSFTFTSNTGFGNNSSAPFNFTPTTSASVFSTPTTTPSFASNFASPPNQALNFGSNSQQQTSTPANPFGQQPGTFSFAPKNDSAFGSQGTSFGNKMNSFNSSQTFVGNASGSNQMFGSGEPQPPAFGNANSSFQFKGNSTFGSNNAANNAAATPAPGIFSFGSNNQPAQQQQQQPSSGVFTFGSGDAAKPAFNFSAGSNLPPPGFASTSSNTSFGGANFASPPMFNIGSGSTNRSRTPLKVKRRN